MFSVFALGVTFGNPKRRVHAVFDHAGSSYALWVTDPVIEREYLAKDDGSYAEGANTSWSQVSSPMRYSRPLGNCPSNHVGLLASAKCDAEESGVERPAHPSMKTL